MAVRVNWQIKAMLPMAGVLLAGLGLFFWVTLSMEGSERPRIMLVAGAGAAVISGVLLIVLAILVQQPLRELRQKIARLRLGDFTVSASFSGRNDEIGDLGRGFNEMVRQLRESREAVELAHSTQMSRAEHLATLGELAAGLAHEIRNPLAGIAGAIDMVSRELPETSSSREICGDVQEEIRQIQRILNELLDYARPRPPRFLAADLGATAEHAISLARQQVLSRPIEIRVSKDSNLPPVEHDVMQMQQVLLNLLLNATQAIEGAGTVELTLQASGPDAVIRVTDTGRGIAPEHLPNIFRPFFTTKGQGTGLGLSLAQRTVEAHAGRIEVSSAPGKGTQFTLRLPFRRAAS